MKNETASADHRLSTEFPWLHRDGKTRCRIIDETAETVRYTFIRKVSLGTIDGEVALEKADFLNLFHLSPSSSDSEGMV